MTRHFLITGSRDFPGDRAHVIYETLDAYLAEHDDLVMINGCARGADAICLGWAASRGVEVEKYPANWNQYGRAAGPIRNKAMLNRLLYKGGTDVFAFFYGDPAESRGTADMVKQCERANLKPVKTVVDHVSV